MVKSFITSAIFNLVGVLAIVRDDDLRLQKANDLADGKKMAEVDKSR